ncbi:MAG: hypothetical protein AAF481_00435 [Acidobacteriota bacterium]
MIGFKTKLVALILLAAFTASGAWALWPLSTGSADDDDARVIKTDDRGNVYVAGVYQNTITLPGSSSDDATIGAQGLTDLYVAKYSADGELLWVATAGGSSVDEVNGIAIDGGENVYVTGYFVSEIQFRNQQLATISLPPVGFDGDDYEGFEIVDSRSDLFVAKLDSSGDWEWARMAGGPGHDRGFDIEVIPGFAGGNDPIPDGVVIAGEANCPVFLNDSGELVGDDASEPQLHTQWLFDQNDVDDATSGCGEASVLVAKIDTSGSWQWVRRAGTKTSREWAREMAIDDEGRIFLLASYLDDTTVQTAIPEDLSFTGVAGGGVLEFYHRYDFDFDGFVANDGGALEYSSDSGANWYDILAGEADNDPSSTAGNPLRFITGGYPTDPGEDIEANSNPLDGREGWACDVDNPCLLSFGLVQVSLDDFSGQDVRFRWRFGTDDSAGDAGEGWWVDDVEVRDATGNVLFTDDIEGAPTQWQVGASLGGTEVWHQAGDFVNDVNGGVQAWEVLADDSRRDHRLELADSLSIPEGEPSHYIASIGDTDTANPTWKWAYKFPDDVEVHDIAVDDAVNVYIAGTSSATNLTFSTDFGDTLLTTQGAFLGKLTENGGEQTWAWLVGATGGQGFGVALDDNDGVYLAGSYSGNASQITSVLMDPLDAGGGTQTVTLPSANGEDVLVARLDTSGSPWTWVQTSTASDSPGNDYGRAIVTDGDDDVFVAGDFEQDLRLGPDVGQEVSAVGGTDAFFGNLEADTGDWFEVPFESWTVGAEVPAPAGADVSHPTQSTPEIIASGPGNAIGDYFFWSPPAANSSTGPIGQGDDQGHLYVLQPVSAEIKWKVDAGDLTNLERLTTVGASDWPSDYCGEPDSSRPCRQLHIAGTPAEIEPDGLDLEYVNSVNVLSDGSGAEINAQTKVLTATSPGFAVFGYSEEVGNVDPTTAPIVFEIVETVPFDTSLVLDDGLVFQDDQACEIGTPITSNVAPRVHTDYPGKNGYVLFEKAPIDADGPDRAHDRDSRSGSIVAVNEVPLDSDGDDLMVVVWYQLNDRGVAWGSLPTRYDCQWPDNPLRIVIASQTGSEISGQPELDPAIYTAMRLYNQDDPSKPGFNPNDEHAFFAPANSSSGFNALFALRADFTAAETVSTSKPYSILKYFDEGAQDWRYLIYQVRATGEGFDSFQFSGVAGNKINAPYPVRLLGGCEETAGAGSPFYQDYQKAVWARSAGQVVVEYWYPLQPTFHFDRDADDAVEFGPGQCIPWLGGDPNAGDPVDTLYNISWPSDPPVLLVGETLAEPKFGLPDIINQAGVKIVYDELQENQLASGEYDPFNTLARIIDPLSARSVMIDDLPTSIATEIDTATGQTEIVSNAEGTIRLPFSIRSRIIYDGLNNELKWKGIFDTAGTGEDLLMLNVLTDRERSLLKTLDGGDGTEAEDSTKTCEDLDDACTWDESIEALYRLSRNPNQFEIINPDECNTEELETAVEQVCVLFENIANPLCDNPDILATILEQYVVCSEVPPTLDTERLLIGLQDEKGITVENGRLVETEGADGIPEPVEVAGIPVALSAGAARGTGYLTLAFNEEASLSPLPVDLQVIRVDCLEVATTPPTQSTYQGELDVIFPDNVFDEQLTLRHSGDFMGRSSDYRFEWFFHPDEDGTPPEPLPDPDGGQLNGWLQYQPDGGDIGANSITISGSNLQTLSDNWFVARYRPIEPIIPSGETEALCGGGWSFYAGQPGSTALEERAQLAPGWVARVIDGLGPFEARVQDFHAAPTNTYASMLVQLGERYEGDISYNPTADNLNSIGLIEAYETVLRRALSLSVDGTPPVDYAPVNHQILRISSRLSDFYMLLGNEAYGDAQDPMIGFDVASSEYGSLAPAIFTFQNQLSSLLEEELTLLRGRDNSFGAVTASPHYNRLLWNFTTGDGELAYAQNYNVSDQNTDGVIDELDAQILFPQGHGDAWGHYLTAMTTYYNLLRHPFFTWLPRTGAVLVANSPVTVDFLDEQKFAQAAAAKARAGAEIVDLTYRDSYVEDPAGQWQGYEDSDPDRAWGLSGWARRAGQGAYFDWVVANAILPSEDPDPTHVGIQRIDRKNTEGLDQIASQFDAIQVQLDEADAGLNPLGLAKGVVPFDIDPDLVDNEAEPSAAKTHFEQIYDRASAALENAAATFNYANQLSEMLRRNQDSVDALTNNVIDQERAFKGRLIEIFGYPYSDDIGPPGTYPSDYVGPDVYHYMYVDQTDLTGTPEDPTDIFTAEFSALPAMEFFDFDVGNPTCRDNPFDTGCSLSNPTNDTLSVDYHVSRSRRTNAAGMPPTADSFFLVKPPEWTGNRRATGELQDRLSDLLVAINSYDQILEEYDNLLLRINDQLEILEAQHRLSRKQIKIRNKQRTELADMNAILGTLQTTSTTLKRVASGIEEFGKSTSQCVPKSLVVGLSSGGDVFAGVRCAVEQSKGHAKFWVETAADVTDTAANLLSLAKEDVGIQADIEIQALNAEFAAFSKLKELEATLRQEPLLRLEAYQRREIIDQNRGKYLAALAKGQRVLEEMVLFRKFAAADVQQARYQDMTFRVFKNDALQKYRAQFDLAARYAYLAATAYDYETNLVGTDEQAGQAFLSDIVKERAVGQLLDGEPVPGSRGLADAMGRMRENFDVLKGQLGFVNPQSETNRFSLRQEMFRIPDEDPTTFDDQDDQDWRQALRDHYVDDLWQLPEYRRYARPLAPESAGPQPALVIPFETTVTFGLNFFGWPLGPGDSAYDATHFATRIRTVGTWFQDYDGLPLSNTPRVYLLPVGADVLRPPSGDLFQTREWSVVDQVLPVPFRIGDTQLDDPDWIPINDSLSGSFADVRRIGTFRAFHDSGDFFEGETTADSRLIGRSVWNRRWLLIIPGGTLLNDAEEAIDILIDGNDPGGDGTRDGDGIDDILIFFQTYAYTGV